MQTVEQRHKDAVDCWYDQTTADLAPKEIGELYQVLARFEASLPPSAPDRDAISDQLAAVEADAQALIREAAKRDGIAIGVWISRRMREAAERSSGIAEMVRALQPFSDALGDVAEHDCEKWPDAQTIELDGFPEYITVGDLRRARSAIRSLDLPCIAEMWQPIETAPYDVAVEVKVGGMTMLAKLLYRHSENEHGSCDQWVAVNEGEHPPCWSGGACWESNEGEVTSLQPTRWRLAPPADLSNKGVG